MDKVVLHQRETICTPLNAYEKFFHFTAAAILQKLDYLLSHHCYALCIKDNW